MFCTKSLKGCMQDSVDEQKACCFSFESERIKIIAKLSSSLFNNSNAQIRHLTLFAVWSYKFARIYLYMCVCVCVYIYTHPSKSIGTVRPILYFCCRLKTFGFDIKRWIWDERLTFQLLFPFVWTHPLLMLPKVLEHVTDRCVLLPWCVLLIDYSNNK